jgi:D-glycero-D-manno-heptose 1,7-bisphosphate phosphatase
MHIEEIALTVQPKHVAALPGADAMAWRSGALPQKRFCVFLDRDGVINERILDGYVLRWSDFHWRPDALEAMRILTQARMPIVVTSNQSCVGRGLLGAPELEEIMRRMESRLVENGSPLTAWYCCPHAPYRGCDCRKPKPGMLLRAARDLDFDLSQSHLIGDTASDVEAAERGGCVPHLIDPLRADAFLTTARRIVALAAGSAR